MPRHPKLPPGMTLVVFRDEVMKWGRGEQEAIDRIGSIDADELFRAGVTVELAELWRRFYEQVLVTNPTNYSARGRVQLMEHSRTILERLRDDPA